MSAVIAAAPDQHRRRHKRGHHPKRPRGSSQTASGVDLADLTNPIPAFPAGQEGSWPSFPSQSDQFGNARASRRRASQGSQGSRSGGPLGDELYDLPPEIFNAYFGPPAGPSPSMSGRSMSLTPSRLNQQMNADALSGGASALGTAAASGRSRKPPRRRGQRVGIANPNAAITAFLDGVGKFPPTHHASVAAMTISTRKTGDRTSQDFSVNVAGLPSGISSSAASRRSSSLGSEGTFNPQSGFGLGAPGAWYGEGGYGPPVAELGGPAYDLGAGRRGSRGSSTGSRDPARLGDRSSSLDAAAYEDALNRLAGMQLNGRAPSMSVPRAARQPSSRGSLSAVSTTAEQQREYLKRLTELPPHRQALRNAAIKAKRERSAVKVSEKPPLRL